MHGLFVVDKPAGPSSHDVVARLRRATGIKRMGHTGTLDPMATGVLVLLTGRATRLARFLGAGEKVYEATFRLGTATDTYDATGRPVPWADSLETAAVTRPLDRIARADVEAALDGLRGTYLQNPPPFSAKHVGGARAYDLARRRAPVAPAPVPVTVHELELLDFDGTAVHVRIASSPGFYVRSLAHDLGVRLGCGAHAETIRRTRSGSFGVEEAVPLDDLEREGLDGVERLVPMADLLPQLPGVVLTNLGARRAAHGNAIRPGDVAGRLEPLVPVPGEGPVRLLDREGGLLAIAEPGPGSALHPVVVLV